MGLKFNGDITIADLLGIGGAAVSLMYAFFIAQAGVDSNATSIERLEQQALKIEERFITGDNALLEAIQRAELDAQLINKQTIDYVIELKKDLQESDKQIHEKLDAINQHLLERGP